MPATTSSKSQKTPDTADPLAELSFEDAAAELERLVEEMENNVLPLEQMLAHYERGVRLAQQCTLKLSDAEKRIEIIRRLPDGRVSAVPLDPETESVSAPAPVASRAARPTKPAASSPAPASASTSYSDADEDDDELALF